MADTPYRTPSPPRDLLGECVEIAEKYKAIARALAGALNDPERDVYSGHSDYSGDGLAVALRLVEVIVQQRDEIAELRRLLLPLEDR